MKTVKLFIAALLAALLLACQTAPQRDAAGQRPPVERSAAERRAASEAAEPQLNDLENAIAAEKVGRSRRLLRKIDADDLNNEQLFRLRLATIRYYFLSGRDRQIRESLADSNFAFLRSVPLERQIEFFMLYARSLEESGDLRTALRLLILADERLSAAASAENQVQILRMLEQLPGETLLREAKLAPDLYLRGWYDFGLLRHIEPAYGRTDPRALWARRYPRHPGNRYMTLLDAREAEAFEEPLPQFDRAVMTVTFLLPFSDGGLGPIANAIVDGFRATTDQHGITLRALRLDTDTALNPRRVSQLYEQAVNSESDLVVGPLKKAKVDELYATVGKFPVATIALNDISSRPKENLYSYTFNFEYSVEQAAQTAWDHQCRNLAIMAQPESALAERGLATFERAWSYHGGNIIRSEFLDTERRLAEWIADIMDVTNEEVEANKEVFRRNLLKLAQLGVAESDINFLLDGPKEDARLPNVLPHEDARLLLTRAEINRVADEYYFAPPVWERNKPSKLLPARLAELRDARDGPEPRPYRIAEVAEVMTDFFNNATSSYERADIDCMFLAMDSIKASQVRPFLSFYLANDIPLFGTFLLYDRSFNRREYNDLEGITYGELAGIIEERQGLEDNRVFSKRFNILGKDLFLLERSAARFVADAERKPDKKDTSGRVYNYFILGNGGLIHMQDNQFYIITREVAFERGVPRVNSASGLSAFQ